MNNKTHLVSMNQLLGHTAMWAVRQSPYVCPDNMTQALAALEDNLSQHFERLLNGFKLLRITHRNLHTMLEEAFTDIPEILSWNNPKKEQKSPLDGRDKHGLILPEYDFIDLYALARNIANSTIEESVHDEELDNPKRDHHESNRKQ